MALTIGASGLMAAGLLCVEAVIGFPAGLFLRMIWLGIMIVLGAVFYGILLHAFGIIDAASVLARLRRRFGKRSV